MKKGKRRKVSETRARGRGESGIEEKELGRTGTYLHKTKVVRMMLMTPKALEGKKVAKRPQVEMNPAGRGNQNKRDGGGLEEARGEEERERGRRG